MTVETEDETGLLVRRVCATVAHAELSPQAVPQALAALEEVRGRGGGGGRCEGREEGGRLVREEIEGGCCPA